jgi:hypothetical protein
MMRILKSGLLLAAATLLLPVAAHAVPVQGTAAAGSFFGLSITAGPLGSASGTGAITGTSSTDLTTTSTSAMTTGGTGTFNVANFTAPGLALGTLSINNFKLEVALPPSTNTSGAGGIFHVDLGGTVVTVNQGLVIQGGTTTLFDFSKTPTVTTAPAGSLTTLDLVKGTWTIPFTSTSTLSTVGIPVDTTIKTNIVLTLIPEPGTVILLGAGLVGLGALARRKRA